MTKTCAIAIMLAASAIPALAQAGKAEAMRHGDSYTLGNETISAHWSVADHHLSAITVEDRLHHASLTLPVPFALRYKTGEIESPEHLTITDAGFHALVPESHVSRASDGIPGQEFDATFAPSEGGVAVKWSVVLRDGSTYIRQFVTLTAGAKDADLAQVRLIDTKLPDAQVVGSVKGSPIVAGDFFLGFEHPISDSKASLGRATASIERDLPLKAEQSVTYSSVVGVSHTGQMRRDFLAYIERERAHPYRTFLHYNSWYDIGYFDPYGETAALDRVNAFGHELHEKRGVTLDSFLFDDGWDGHEMWNFNKGFPNGFTPIREAAAKYGAAPGVWMSPWGGYDKPKQERVAFGRKAGYEIVDDGFALSGPKYYDRFRDVMVEMIQKYGVNQFKIDGTGNANTVFPGSRFDSDFDAAIHLIGELRVVKPDIFINLTTGTYPSPFWLLYADSIWRGGEDDDFTGVGTYRERWMTYRDADTYAEVVKAGPLYPLNSLMLHGMIFATRRKHLNDDPGHDFTNEIHSYFGTGTQLQEMYITPSLMTDATWDDLAEAAKWSRANADVLKDTHWVGGDPQWLEPYGWASWSPRRGILVLRNPSDKPQTISVDVQKAFELPKDAPQRYEAKSPWKADASKPAFEMKAGEAHAFALKPFEVLTFNLDPQ